MQGGDWLLFVLDLIGGGALAAAVVYATTLRRLVSRHPHNPVVENSL
jgi:hypothetical protein